VHHNLAFLLAGLIGLHVLAALHHQFIVRDGTLRRMLTWRA
jgi:cytochrome b561